MLFRSVSCFPVTICSTSENIKLQEKLRNDLAQEKSEKIDEYRKRIEAANSAILRDEAEAASVEAEINDLLTQIEDREAVSARIQKILNLESNLEKKKTNARKTVQILHILGRNRLLTITVALLNPFYTYIGRCANIDNTINSTDAL